MKSQIEHIKIRIRRHHHTVKNNPRTTMRSRSGSITPAYSTDRALLLSHYPTTRIVSSLEEAKSAASKLTIFEDTAFKRRVFLLSDEDWLNFLDSCRDESDPNKYSLELLLKKCYHSTYSMPPSPTSLSRTQSSEAETSNAPALTI